MRIRVEQVKSITNRIRKRDVLLLEIYEENGKVPTLIKVKVEDFVHEEERCSSCKISLQLQEKKMYMRKQYCLDCFPKAVEKKRLDAAKKTRKSRPFQVKYGK